LSKRKNSFDYDLIAIGSGSGGNVAATIAARQGKKVAIFDKEEKLGGECPNWACVPTKALLHAAHVYETAKNGAQYGLKAESIDFDYKKVKNWKDLVVKRTGTDDGDEVFAEKGVDVFHAKVRFLSPHEISADGKRYTARKFLIASGTSDYIPPIEGLEDVGYLNFRQAIDLKSVPKSLFIIGGGAIGVEFAQLFSIFGAKVHLIEIAPKLLGREEPEAADLVKAVFESKGIEVITRGKIYSVGKSGNQKKIHYSDGDTAHSVVVDEILVASGKKPNLDLGLENANVDHDKHGIKADQFMRTSNSHIFAAGDVVGPYQFTHTASYQSRIAAHNMFSHKSNYIKADYSAIPRCIFVEPEVASVGITEADVRAHGINPRIGLTSTSIIGRANTSNQSIGFVKIVANHKGVILGATIVAPRAGEMIHELALAVKMRLRASDVASVVHAFPTWSEAVRIAAAKIS